MLLKRYNRNYKSTIALPEPNSNNKPPGDFMFHGRLLFYGAGKGTEFLQWLYFVMMLLENIPIPDKIKVTSFAMT